MLKSRSLNSNLKHKVNQNKISLANSGNFEFFDTNLNAIYLTHAVTFKFSQEKSVDKVFDISKSHTFDHVNRYKSINVHHSHCYTKPKTKLVKSKRDGF